VTGITLRPALLSRAMLGLRLRGQIGGDPDLPALEDPVAGLGRSIALLSIVSLVIVALTAENHVGAGYHLSDVGALLLLYGVATAALSRVPWTRFGPSWAAVFIGAQILFVVSLTTVTGGGRSPYFALYAPILALAGWHLRRDGVIVAIASVAAVEWWRAMVVEGGRGSADQLTVALPLFAAIAALAHLTAQRLLGATVAIRRDQVRTADTLVEVRRLTSGSDEDPLAAASDAAGRIFDSVARVVAVDPPSDDGTGLLARTGDGKRLSVAISGPSGTYGVLELEREAPFSTNEARLAAMLGESAAQAFDARGPRRRAHV
jgi:hypothetical protein